MQPDVNDDDLGNEETDSFLKQIEESIFDLVVIGLYDNGHLVISIDFEELLFVDCDNVSISLLNMSSVNTLK
ncbi:hypothetical protein O9G_004015 [Rozella allomycis CSF55]|uniref:Uncharacterized protein n=1 Tax=Rozella allomycis (strain CSF55) TaxID=988480 RepID=A0A075B190_ROZAC|nr:hypothetical protein O9G_004015 [Rozella allomycis CSF55]|eukprot:EPZ36356.1 hypothetical protein O9G_004015 [Rozella allomycis CSF55]